jgi:hypothetical protein
MPKQPAKCEWITLHDALKAFVRCETGHQGGAHIKPLHWYVACRLVIEGGFHPDDITPRPPFTVRAHDRRHLLEYDAGTAGGGERTVLGGLKTKAVDVVVTKDGVGPVMAISMKGTLNAFRNLTNRMEEAVGDCTNLHIAYPALVYGFLQVMRANRERKDVEPNDIAVCQNGEVAESIRRYHDVLARLANREDVRAETTKYEGVALALVNPEPPAEGEIISTFPPAGSSLSLADFFGKLYSQYDQRFVYAAPALEAVTRRIEWDAKSPALAHARLVGYAPRIDHSE